MRHQPHITNPGPLPDPDPVQTPIEFTLDADGDSLLLRFPADQTDPDLQAMLHAAAVSGRTSYALWFARPQDGTDRLEFKVAHVDGTK